MANNTTILFNQVAKTGTFGSVIDAVNSNFDLAKIAILNMKGKSAYEIWLEQDGNEGKSVQEFLASLKESGFETEAVPTRPSAIANINEKTIYAVPSGGDTWSEYIYVGDTSEPYDESKWLLLATHDGSGLSGALVDIADLKSSTTLNSLRISELSDKTKLLVVTEEGGLYVIDKNGNIAFKVVMGNVDALGLGENLIGIILELIRNNADLTPALNLIGKLEGAVQVIKEKTNLFNVITNKEGLCIVDKDGNVGWQIIPIVTGEKGVYFTDKDGNIGMSIVNGLFDFSGFGQKTLAVIEEKAQSKKLIEAFHNADDNYENIERIRQLEDSVRSLASLTDANVQDGDKAVITVTIPPSTTNTEVPHGMVRLGLHWGSKPNFVSHAAINEQLAIWDEVYFGCKCRKDFSDVRVFDSEGNMLPIFVLSQGNYEVIEDNNLTHGLMLTDSAGYFYSRNSISVLRSTNNGVTWNTLFSKSSIRLEAIDETSGNGFLYVSTSDKSSEIVESDDCDIIRIPMSNYEPNIANAQIIAHTWYYNYYYHATINITGTATQSGTLVLQATPSDGTVKRYSVKITEGMTAEQVCNAIAQLNITDWTASYSGGNTLTLDSDRCLVYIEPEIEESVSGLYVNVVVTKDGATKYYPTSRHTYIYHVNGHKYIFIWSYQAPYNVFVQRSVDDGEFTTVIDNQTKFDVTGRNGQHVHNIRHDAVNDILYVGIDDSNNQEFGASVMKSFDNGDTWVNYEFSDEEKESNPINAQIWQNHRAKDYTPVWFSEDGTFSLGGGETNVMGGYALLRTDNSDAVEHSNPTLADKKYSIAVNNGNSTRAAINSFDDNFIVAPFMSGIVHNTAQLILSTDKGNNWKTIWHMEDPMASPNVGNGHRYSRRCTPPNDEEQLIFTYMNESNKFHPLRVYRGGEHYYAEILVNIGTLPAEGATLRVESGYAMKYPNIMPFNRDVLVKPVYSIKFDEGIGNKVSDSFGNVGEIVGDYEWTKESIPFGNYVPAITEYKRGYGLKLGLGSYINFGKIKSLDFSRGFTVVLIVNCNFRGGYGVNPNYYGYCPIVRFGNVGIYAHTDGYNYGNTQAFTHCSTRRSASFSSGSVNIHAIRIESNNIEDTDRPIVHVKCDENFINASAPKARGDGEFEYVNLSKGDLIVGTPNKETGNYKTYNDTNISLCEIRIYDSELTDEQVDSIIFGYTRRFERNY